ncbi:MAG: RNA-binding protein [Candidatus Kapaibacterium sp.]|jgi:RNA recognition motif-containing protein|nr:MAG: RNA-binding protein [Candidatus Kapabacteria bacterium]ROL58173.1 MAG: RNA-binding protein [Bacteroidetes/Chlorobi group bacterium Naka2016]
MNIYVGNLSFSTTQEELENLFSQYGEVESVRIVRDRQTGRSRGFGFVEMSEEHGKVAIQALNGKEFGGRNILVNEAKQQERPQRNFSRSNNTRNYQDRY